MPKKIPTLSAVADDEKKKGKIATALAALSSALGIGAATPDAKMSKKTVTTKRTEMEESDDSEEEEASVPMSTEKSSGAESSKPAASDAADSADAEADDSGAESSKPADKTKATDDEDAKVARGWAAAEKAYAKVASGVDAYGVRGPKGLLKMAEKATGTKGAASAISALHSLRTKAANADAAVIQRLASVEAKAIKIEASSRKDRVNAIVAKAKAEGRANSKDLRAELRTYGNERGTRALAKLVATLQKVRTLADGAREGKIDGASVPAADEQKMLATMFGDLKGDAYKEAVALYEDNKRKANGAAKGGEA